MKEKKYYGYIAGLKGIACFLVMVGHFFAAIKYAEFSEMAYPKFMKFVNSPLGLIQNEGFWLYLFFVASGFLLAQANISDIRDLVIRCVKRLLRLAFPILFAGVFIYIIALIFGMQNGLTVTLFKSSWFQNFYANGVSIKDVLVSPYDVLILENSDINAPYWVLHDMLMASLIIYVNLYLQAKVSKYPVMKYIVNVLCLVVCFKVSEIVFACGFGMIVGEYQQYLEGVLTKIRKILPIFVILLLVLYYVHSDYLTMTLFFGGVILTIPYCTVIDKFLANGVCKWLGTNSFGIYSLHWPVFCSIGAWLMLKLIPVSSLWVGYGVAIVVSLVISLGISWVYTLTAEKWAGWLTNWLTSGLARVLKKA